MFTADTLGQFLICGRSPGLELVSYTDNTAVTVLYNPWDTPVCVFLTGFTEDGQTTQTIFYELTARENTWEAVAFPKGTHSVKMIVTEGDFVPLERAQSK